MTALPIPSSEQRSFDPMISLFEDEQKTKIYSQLGEFFINVTFCDVNLIVGTEIVSAHKAVLAASSKFFLNAFTHYPNLQNVDLVRELSPHGIEVAIDDVRLIIGILYCVGTLDISAPKVDSLLMIAQVLGIPTLIKFLRRIKDTLKPEFGTSLSPVKRSIVYNQLLPSLNKKETRSLTFEQHSRRLMNDQPIIQEDQDPPSRSGSRATLASLSSFAFNPISSPPTETNNPQILDNFDPSFLSQLHANQIDDLESALLPHLHPSEERSNQDAKNSQNDDSFSEEPILNLLPDEPSNDLPMIQQSHNEELPKGSSTPLRRNLSINLTANSNNTTLNDCPLDSPPPYETMNMEEVNEILPKNNQLTSPKPLEKEEIANEEESAELQIPLNENEEAGKSITLTVPGSSKSFTLNVSADALNKMRLSVIGKHQNVRKKTAFACQLCSKCFPSRRMLAKHEKYHVDKNTSCKQCGQVFNHKWKLEQHIAKEHVNQALECKECGKQFHWRRNLLAHISLHHQREIRYRCKNCPLTFLKKKAFILHHREKHKEALEPWCGLCYEIFDGMKQREDHSCVMIENTGRVTICHRHNPPLVFKYQKELLEHIKTEHEGENDDLNGLQETCPVCNKKFLLKKNLLTHMKRFHETEGSSGAHKCRICQKSFLYLNELESHENTHKDSKVFKCHCGKGYSSKKALNDHVKIVHENKESYSCNVCGKVLRDKYKLKYHMMVHSNQRNFKCSHCSVEFKGGENLRRHVLKFHKDAINS